MAEAPTTKVTADALKAAAKKLDDLFADTSAFENLEKFEDLQAGPDTFDSANWLEALVDDRLKGLQAHGDAMKASVTDLAEKLVKIEKQFRDADDANADALQNGALEIIDTWVGDTMDISFEDAENTDVNFKGPDTKDVPREDHFDIDKGNAVYKDGKVTIKFPKADGLDYDGQDPGGIFDEANEDGEGEDFKYNDGFIFDEKGDHENKEGAKSDPGAFTFDYIKDYKY
jgi:hypothetical protein